jgi:hypothetical protein
LLEIYAKAAAATGEKDPFDLNAFPELVKAGFADEIRMASASEKTTNVGLQKFFKTYPMLVLKNRFEVLNANKRGDEIG